MTHASDKAILLRLELIRLRRSGKPGVWFSLSVCIQIQNCGRLCFIFQTWNNLVKQGSILKPVNKTAISTKLCLEWIKYIFSSYYFRINTFLLIPGDPSIVVVTWVTENKTTESVVRYGYRLMDHRQTGIQESFLDGGSEQRRFIIHRVAITNLTAGAMYREFPVENK